MQIAVSPPTIRRCRSSVRPLRPTYYVFRQHTIPSGQLFENMVTQWYVAGLKKNGVLPPSFDINFKIRKHWRREDIWNGHTFHIQVPSHGVQEQAMLSDSMDQHWIDIKPSFKKYNVHGTLNVSNMRCSICLEQFGDKIRLVDCNCLFHRNCIEIWTSYGSSCPKCFKTINMTHVNNICKNPASASEKKKVH